jgi:hypothetical protein
MVFVSKSSIAARDRVANDWGVLGLANVGASAGLAQGAWLFNYQSSTASVSCTYAFVGMGFGLGLSPVPGDVSNTQSGARIRGWRGFSADNLDGAWGMVIDAGADFFGLSLGNLGISAFDDRFIPYFSFQQIPGPDSGLGIDASCIQGRWMLLSLLDRRTGKNWNAFQSQRARLGFCF